ncbi:MAG: hypothetical protein K0R10_1048 [Alphaproteobacteria bacterium]|jgi:hypothetical protein|nr:hypothetical protein [Alphaproteobacteria bacterium]
MKKLKSLVLTFALAAGSAIGLGTAAQAQTIDVRQTQTAQNELVTNNYIDADVINSVAQLPLLSENTYYRAGRGFISARVEATGENVGVEFQLNNGYKTPVRAYNLDDAVGAMNFGNAKMNASALENRLAFNENQTRIYARAYPNYIYSRPLAPIILIGRPWNNHGFHHHDNHGWRQQPVIVPQPRIVIRVGGGNDHRGNDHYRGNDRGRDNHRDNHRGNDRGGRGDRDHRGPGGHRH